MIGRVVSSAGRGRTRARRDRVPWETNLLRTGAEERFDQIVAATREFFDVGAASMSLIGRHTQHFKSAIGLLRSQTPRQIALCTATVEQNSMLIINETLTDDRFSSNPLVVGEPHIRFYAGYPLHGPRGWLRVFVNEGSEKRPNREPRDRLLIEVARRRAAEKLALTLAVNGGVFRALFGAFSPQTKRTNRARRPRSSGETP